MTDTKRGTHTPGPWNSESHLSDGGILITGADGGPVAIVEDSATSRPDETGRANARLIAAAPRMLEALDWIGANGLTPTDREFARAVLADIEAGRGSA